MSETRERFVASPKSPATTPSKKLTPQSPSLRDVIFRPNDELLEFVKPKPKQKSVVVPKVKRSTRVMPTASSDFDSSSSSDSDDGEKKPLRACPKKAAASAIEKKSVVSKVSKTDQVAMDVSDPHDLYTCLIETDAIKSLKKLLIESKGDLNLNDERVKALLAPIGNVNFENSNLLFEQKSKQLDQHVREFQPMFFDQHAALINAVQKEKHAHAKKNTPSCLTHIHAEIDGVDHFIVAPSRSEDAKNDKELVDALESTCQAYNKNSSQKINCHVLSSCNSSYHQLLQDLLKFLGLKEATHAKRDCAEKLFTWEMAKHFLHYPNTKIKDVRNYENYPRKNGIQYGEGEFKHVSREPKSPEGSRFIAGEYKLDPWSCCKNCKDNALAYLGFMAAMKEIGSISPTPASTQNKKRKMEQGGVPISPAKIVVEKNRRNENGESPLKKQRTEEAAVQDSPSKVVAQAFSGLGLGSGLFGVGAGAGSVSGAAQQQFSSARRLSFSRVGHSS